MLNAYGSPFPSGMWSFPVDIGVAAKEIRKLFDEQVESETAS